MKKRSARIGIILGILLLLGLLVALMGGSGNRLSWVEGYAREGRAPYGANVIFQLLEHYFPGERLIVLEDSLALPRTDQNASYIFIGGGQLLDSSAVERLLAFVAAGNKAFIASRAAPNPLLEHLLPNPICDDRYAEWQLYPETVDSAVYLSMEIPGTDGGFRHRFRHWRRGELLLYRWQFIDPELICPSDQRLEVLGEINDSLPNFIRLPHGKGEFLVHTVPLAFSNIALLDEDALAYADQVFSWLEPGTIYWDEYSKTSEEIASSRHQQQAGFPPAERRLNHRSPLQYVLSQPPLTWAWYLTLGLTLLYLIFRGRRRQRIIPVLEPNVNTSMEFLSTIGRLYFMQNDHRRLALQQFRLFCAFLRQHYGWQAREFEEEFIEKLAGKSEIPAIHIRSIIHQHQEIQTAERISASTLIDFHQKLDFFYKNRK